MGGGFRRQSRERKREQDRGRKRFSQPASAVYLGSTTFSRCAQSCSLVHPKLSNICMTAPKVGLVTATSEPRTTARRRSVGFQST